jgi:hypothetical protein
MKIYLFCLIVFLSLVEIIYASSDKLDEEIDPHKLSLEAHSKREHERARQRQLIYDTGSNRQCFDVNYNRGYEDYLKNPFKANNNRGDWGRLKYCVCHLNVLTYQLYLFQGNVCLNFYLVLFGKIYFPQ